MWNKIKTFYSNHPLWAALITMVVTALVLAWLVMLFLDMWTHHGSNSTVPDIRHMSYTEAEAVVARHDLSLEISDSIYDKSLAPGTVVESWPKAGAVVKRGRNVYVTVTAFSPKHITISTPVTGVSVRQAMSHLTALGITAIRFVNVPSQYPDLVERALYNGRPLGVGSVIPVDATVVLEVGVAAPEPEEEEAEGVDEDMPEEDDGMSSYQEI